MEQVIGPGAAPASTSAATSQLSKPIDGVELSVKDQTLDRENESGFHRPVGGG
jgi:hypothetical protein